MHTITYHDFERVELRSGTIIKVEPFERARKPAFKIWADFGSEFGVKQTSAQVTVHYTPEKLINKRIIGCLNLGSKILPVLLLNFCWLDFRIKQRLSV